MNTVLNSAALSVTTAIIDAGLLMSLGFPPYALVANSLVRHYYGYFIHADLPWNYGVWNKVFVSPVMHQWHHANEPAAYNTNFATVFSVFDRAFGTYRVPSLCNIPLGISYDVGGSLWGQLLYPLKLSSYFKKLKKHKLNQSILNAENSSLLSSSESCSISFTNLSTFDSLASVPSN